MAKKNLIIKIFIVLFFVTLCTIFWLVQLDDNGHITISIQAHADNCTAALAAYKFTENKNVTLILENAAYINYGWVRHVGLSGSAELIANVTKLESRTFVVPDKSKGGVWEFEFLHLIDNMSLKPNLLKRYGDHYYTASVCRIDVTILPAKDNSQNVNMTTIMIWVGGTVALIIILVQAASIIYLKAKAKALNRHQNLSKKSGLSGNDRARYCSDPGKMLIKDQIQDETDQECIYEAPNIELPDRMPLSPPQPQIPPQPPAITTMPRTPRSDRNTSIGPAAMLAGFMRNPGRSLDNQSTLPRPKHMEREINVAHRPQYPLPTENGGCEVYEETESEDNSYELPPIITTTMPSRPVVRQRPVPTNTMPIPKPKPAVETLKTRPHKPPVTLKPTVKCAPPQNELEEAFKRRNNVKQVPVVSIPDPGTLRGHSVKPRPPPIAQSKPRSPPIPQSVPEEIYTNERHDSSDEEWTYEPLKPLNSYNMNNIYNM